jgi:hypothetical protein
LRREKFRILDPDRRFGPERNGNDRDVFVVTTVDGRRLTFDAVSGELLDTVAGPAPDVGRGECF